MTPTSPEGEAKANEHAEWLEEYSNEIWHEDEATRKLRAAAAEVERLKRELNARVCCLEWHREERDRIVTLHDDIEKLYVEADKKFREQKQRADRLAAELAACEDKLAQAEYANEGLRDSKGMQDYYKRELKAAEARLAVLVKALKASPVGKET